MRGVFLLERSQRVDLFEITTPQPIEMGWEHTHTIEESGEGSTVIHVA